MKSRFDSVLVAATIAFAFLAASFAATNSDLWLHLATGRLIASGDYSFGVDPFSYLTEGRYWTNHAWLFDLAAYEVFQHLGGAALVGIKAIGVALLAGIMVRTGLKGGAQVWLACGSTLLAILAMSPRLLVQPQCVSLLFLAVCFSLLQSGGRALRWVPVLMVLWVNVDAWFMLGLLMVIAHVMWGTPALPGSRLSVKQWILLWFAALITGCLGVGLYLVLGIGAPAALITLFVLIQTLILPIVAYLGPRTRPSADSGSPLRGVRLVLLCFAACLINPHHFNAFAESPPELTVGPFITEDPLFAGVFTHPWRLDRAGLAGWAFPALLALSGLSFIPNQRRIGTWPFAVWLPLAALAAWQTRLVPFFAVVAGPILAMNLGGIVGSTAFPRTGRRLVLVLAVFLLVLTWPGWLQSFSARDRALAWEVSPDPSLVRAAERVHRMQAPRVFNTHPEAAHYVAWFAPGTQTGIDSRLLNFSLGMHRDVMRFLEGGPNSRKLDYMMRTVAGGDVDVILISDSDRGLLATASKTVGENTQGFILLAVDGNSLTLKRNGRFDPERLAFASTSSPAPESGPAFLNEPPEWWNLAAYRAPRRTWEGDAAPTYLRLFEQVKGPERSPALPLLAIRSGRTGLAAEPRGDEVWVALAQAYLFQSRSTLEAGTTGEFTLVKYLRHVQTVGALQQAVLANPDNATAHEILAGAFGERRMTDLALHHRREQLRLLKRSRADAERLTAVQEVIDELESMTFESENRFRVHTHNLAGDPFQRARIARELGLGSVAIDTLVKSHPDLYGVEGLRMLLDLLVQTGRLNEARVLLDRDELKSRPGTLDLFTLPGGTKEGLNWRYAIPAYDWFDLCQCAAAGRYDRAEIALERLREQIHGVQAVATPNVRGVFLRVALSELGANHPLNRLMVRSERERWATNVAQTRFLSSVRGDLYALSGLLHLERGAIGEAKRDFHQALERYAENAGLMAVHPGRPLAVRYREALRAAE